MLNNAACDQNLAAQQSRPQPHTHSSEGYLHVVADKGRPSQTDVHSMVNSTITQTGGTPCLLVDMGAFHLAEFAATLCRPFVGSAVHGGVHMLQIQSAKLSTRMFVFPVLNSTFKVGTLGLHFCCCCLCCLCLYWLGCVGSLSAFI